MEPTTSLIKHISQSVVAPKELRTRILNSVTQDQQQRSTSDSTKLSRLSPYSSYIHKQAFLFASIVSLFVVIGISSLSTNTIHSNSMLAIVDSVIMNSIVEDSDAWDESVGTIDEMITYSELIYTDNDQVSLYINNPIT